MKKFLISSLLVLMLCGCGGNKDNGVFSVTDEQAQAYNEHIASVLSENNWSYNPDTITFANAELPENDNDFYNDVDKVVSDGAAKLAALADKEAVLACVPLQHINGYNVGTGCFYFYNNKPVCEYYSYKDKYYSLSTKNPFELTGVFTAFENPLIKADFAQQKSFKAKLAQAQAVNNGIIASIQEDNTIFYYNSADSYRVWAKADYTGMGLVPLDVTLGDDFGTILLGEPVKVQQTENENEVSDIISEPPARSARIAITDSKGKASGKLIPTTVSSFTSLTQVGDRLFFARDKSIDEFVYKNKELEKVKTYVLDHYVNTIRTADIDGNGTVEFIVSDGTNIYIYEKTATFNLVWRSSSYLSSITGSIYTGDLNGDGIKELYVTDSLGVTARYILTEQGFKISSGGIVSGGDDRYIIADFNADGKADYIVMPAEGGKPKQYLAQ